MPSNLERLARLSARMERDAWIQLNRMRHHPKFDALLEFLESVPGTVLPIHVEAAAQQILDDEEQPQ